MAMTDSVFSWWFFFFVKVQGGEDHLDILLTISEVKDFSRGFHWKSIGGKAGPSGSTILSGPISRLNNNEE